MPHTASWNRLGIQVLVLLSCTQFAVVRAQMSEPLTPPSARPGYYEQATARNTCDARDERCGWHVPAVKAQGARRDSGTVWIVVVCLAGVFALGLM